jgi:two-component system, LuxR family, sensor kinase FixL
LRIDRTCCNLPDIWRRAWQSLGLGTHAGQATLYEHLEGVEDLALKCWVDPLRLEQVFRNLFENSIAAASGLVRIDIECRRNESADIPALEIAVRDDGPGIPHEERSEIFAPYYTTKREGTGLGLAIVRRIVEAHEGKIELTDLHPGSGAEFVITLPLPR